MSEQTVTAEALNDLRQRYLDGKPWTREELKSAIQTMIGQRLHDVQTAAAPKTKKVKATPVNLDDMLLPAPGTETTILLPSPATETKRIDATKENASNVPKVSKPAAGFFS